LIITFVVSAAIVLFIALREKDPALRLDYISIAGNFILLNGLMSFFIDSFGITLRNSLHASLQREEEISALNEQLHNQVAELERFTYSVSHDLRSSLVTIRAFLGLLERDIEKDNSDKIKSDIERIEGATDKMNELLTDLLELSRVGRLINPPEEIDTVELINDAVESVDARLRSKNILLNIEPSLPNLHGDRIRLREVFENLIDNAAKYMGEQSDPVIEIGVQGQGEEPIFYVKDNGLGVEEQYQEKIFALFEKLDPIIEGTGIGLALIKRIIETHSGEIWVESEGLGTGSTFCFTIPDNRNP
jgi:signal transduction histidine kinase